MSKTYFIMNDRADSSKGYTEVSEDYFKGYIDGFTDGKPYYINLGYAVMETTEEHYRSYYKDWSRRRYLDRLDTENQLLSYDALNSDEFSGSDIVIDTSEPFEDVVDRKLMIKKLPELLSRLSETERELILDIYYRNIGLREISRETGIPLVSLFRRKARILKKLSIFFDD